MLKRHSQLMLVLLGAADLLAVCAAWALAYPVRVMGSVHGYSRHDAPPFETFFPAIGLSLLLAALIFSRFNLYGIKRTRTLGSEAADLARAVLLTWALTYVIINYLQRVPISRLMMGAVLVWWLILATTLRLAARATLRAMRRRGWNLRHAAIVGTGRLGQSLYHAIGRNTWTGLDVNYFVAEGNVTSTLLGREVRGPVTDIESIVTRHPVDVVFVALSGRQREQLEDVINNLATVSADVRILPDLLSFHFLRHDVSQLDNLPIIGLTSTPHDGWNALLKRAFDIVGSLIGIALCALPMLMIALAIKVTGKGPVFYSQQRASLAGHPFRILKFRTMRPDAEHDTGAVWATRDDPRITPIGRFLRRTSLDELPQLFNVLTGQMSLVGPRPERPELIERFRKQVPRYVLRSRVKAGLTGWAQVHGLRGHTSLRKRVQYDLHYVANWSFGLDLRIVLMTPFRGFIHPNAY